MSSTATETPPRKRRSVLAVTVVVVAVLVVAFFVFAGLYTDILWYDQLGFLSVLTTQWAAAGGLFAIGFVAMAVPVFISLMLAYRLRPVYAKLNSQIDRYQQVVEPLRRLATFGIPAVLGLFAGVSSATRWQTSLTYWNRTPSGVSDPSSDSTPRSTCSSCPSTRASSASPRPSCSSRVWPPWPPATSTERSA